VKKKIRMKELLATFLVIILCLCCLPDIQASVGNESVVKTENDAQKRKTTEFADVPINILSLIPKENRIGSIISESTDSSELYTIRTENPETGEGTLFVYLPSEISRFLMLFRLSIAIRHSSVVSAK